MFMDVPVRELEPGRVIYNRDWGYVVVDAITVHECGCHDLAVSAFDPRPEAPRRPQGTLIRSGGQYVTADYGRDAMGRGE